MLSPAQLPVLMILSLSLLVSAEEQQSLIPEPLRPIRNSPASSLSDDTIVNVAGRNATINLYPASASAFSRYVVNFHCEEREFNTISLAPNACLSGDYYPNKNIKITEAPIRPSGEIPTLVYYHNGGCTGEPKYKTLASQDVTYSCLWSGSNPKYWSLVYRCSDWPLTVQGADAYIDAIPPPASGNDEPQDAVVAYRLSPECSVVRLGGDKTLNVPVDVCLTTPGFAISIRRPAFCSNGTRARLARFADPICGAGSRKLSSRHGLIDVHDGNLFQCMPTGLASQDDRERFGSVMFWCDGFGSTTPDTILPPTLPPAPAWILTQWERPFVRNPETDTCIDFTIPKILVESPGICSDGRFANMAFYSRRNCVGPPHLIKDALYMEREKEFYATLAIEGTSSIAFLCDGLGTQVRNVNGLPLPESHARIVI